MVATPSATALVLGLRPPRRCGGTPVAGLASRAMKRVSSSLRWALRLFLFFAFLGGCSDPPRQDDTDRSSKRSKKSKKSDESSEESTSTPEGACAELAEATCKRHARCEQGYWLKLTYGDADACKEAVKASCLDTLGAPDVAAGPADVLACAKARKKSDCHEGSNTIAECILRGKRAGGASCAMDAQCASSRCTRRSLTDRCGTCVAALSPGDACKSNPPTSCGEGLRCVNGKCAEPAPLGGDCSKTGYCAGFTKCQNGKCVELPGEGAACNPEADPPRDCHFAYRCDNASKKCVPRKLVGPGEKCSFGANGTYCAVGYCAMPTNICKPMPKEGEACGDSLACSPPFECLDSVCKMAGKVECG
jgi:hypothetical protein